MEMLSLIQVGTSEVFLFCPLQLTSRLEQKNKTLPRSDKKNERKGKRGLVITVRVSRKSDAILTGRRQAAAGRTDGVAGRVRVIGVGCQTLERM